MDFRSFRLIKFKNGFIFANWFHDCSSVRWWHMSLFAVAELGCRFPQNQRVKF